MKKICRFLSVFLVLILCFSFFAACAGKDGNGDNGGGGGGGSTLPPEEEEVYEMNTGSGDFIENYTLVLNTESPGIIMCEDTRYGEISNGRFLCKSVSWTEYETRLAYNVYNQEVFKISDIALPRAYLKIELTASLGGQQSQYYTPVGEIRIYDKDGNAVHQLTVRSNDFSRLNNTETVSFYIANYFNISGGSVAYAGGYTFNSPINIYEIKITAVPHDEFIQYDLADYLESENSAELDLGYNPDVLYFMDERSYTSTFRQGKDQFDIASIITTIQGLANRDGAHLYVRGTRPVNINDHYVDDIDGFWLDWLQTEGELLEGREIVELYSLKDLLTVFEDNIKGLVVWDENVPATYNAAFTAAGCDSLLPVRYDANPDSLMNILRNDYDLEVKVNLNGKFDGSGTVYKTSEESKGSAKVDTYIWACVNYLENGKTDPHYLSYYLDAYSDDYEQNVISRYNISGHTVNLRDYGVKMKSFFYDLSPWPQSDPTDDPDQPYVSDFELTGYEDPVSADFWIFNRILSYCNKTTKGAPVRASGFPPFSVKYNYRQDGLGDAEPEGNVTLLYGTYNVYLTAESGDASNMSVFCQAELCDELYEYPGDKEAYLDYELENKNYIYLYMGDYDAPDWVTKYLSVFIQDSTLGSVPTAFPLIPMIMEKVPMAYNYVIKTINKLPEERRKNIYWVAGNNGFGYSRLPSLASEFRPEGLYTTFEEAIKYAADILADFGVDIMGQWIANTPPEPVRLGLAKYFPKGIINVLGDLEYSKRLVKGEGIVEEGVPIIKNLGSVQHYQMRDLTPQTVISSIGIKSNPQQPYFVPVRCILTDPSSIDSFSKLLKANPQFNAEIVDPYTFFHLYREAYNSGYDV